MKRRKTYSKYDKSLDTPTPEPIKTHKGDIARKNINKALMLSSALQMIHEKYDYHSNDKEE